MGNSDSALTAANRRALLRLAGRGAGTSRGATVDDLQGLLLQISLAIMIVFIIAFFVFRTQSEKNADEQREKETHQRLVLAADTVEQQYRTRYGLNLLCSTQPDGTTTFEPKSVIAGEGLAAAPVVRRAFCEGTRYASADYADTLALAHRWRNDILTCANAKEAELKPEEIAWLTRRLETGVANVRADVFGLQRACAAELQRTWLADPTTAGEKDVRDLATALKGADPKQRLALASQIADLLKMRSLAKLSALAEGELLK